MAGNVRESASNGGVTDIGVECPRCKYVHHWHIELHSHRRVPEGFDFACYNCGCGFNPKVEIDKEATSKRVLHVPG